MEPDLARSIFEGTLKSTRQLRGFHLAGGEAFLNFPLLVEIMEMATEYGIPIDYIETNASWFVDHNIAVEKLSLLRKAGLRCLLISASPFHAEYIPLEKTMGAVRASLEIFDRYGTMIWLPEFLSELRSITSTDKVSFDDYTKILGDYAAHNAACYGGQLISGGRSAFTLTSLLPKLSLQECFGSNCEYELLRCGSGHFDLYGNIIPGCCSGITIGDAHDLISAYTDFRLADHLIIEILATYGVKGLYEMAVSNHGYTAKESYPSKCGLCMDIRQHLVLTGATYYELTPKQFYE